MLIIFQDTGSLARSEFASYELGVEDLGPQPLTNYYRLDQAPKAVSPEAVMASDSWVEKVSVRMVVERSQEWLKFQLINKSDREEFFYIWKERIFRSIDVYVFDASGKLVDSQRGGTVPKNLEVRFRGLSDVFEVKMAAGERVTILVSYSANSKMRPSLYLGSLAHLTNVRSRTVLSQMVFLGAILVVCIFSALIGVSLKQKVYYYYSIYGISTALCVISSELAMGNRYFLMVLSVWCLSVSSIFSILFFLNLFPSPNTLKARVGYWLVFLCGVVPFIGLFVNVEIAIEMSFISVAFSICFSTYWNIAMVFQRRPGSRLVLAAWGILGSSALLSILMVRGTITFDLFGILPIQVGLVVEMLLLATAVRARIDSLLDMEKSSTERSDKLSELIKVLCHDLANPLSVISGFSEQGVNLSDGEEDIEKFHNIEHQSRALGETINRVRLIQALDAGKVRYRLKSHSVNQLVSKAIKANQVNFSRKQVRLTLEAAYVDDDPVVVGDDELLCDFVLSPVLNNGLKYSYRGGLLAIKILDGVDFVEVQVTDGGCGVSSVLKKGILDSSTFNSEPGTLGELGAGLSLSVAKACLDHIGGTIEIESTLNEGTTVKIRLKKAEAPSQAA